MLPLKSFRTLLRQTLFRALSLVLCASFLLPLLPARCEIAPANNQAIDGHKAFEALQAAEILEVKPELERFLALRRHDASPAVDNELLALRATLLRKILLGFVEIRQASNKSDVELSYAYDVLYREQHHEANVFQALNLFNFTQLAVLYTIAPWSRINKQFTQSSVIGCINAGLSTGLPIISILYGKYHTIKDPAPPKYLHSTLDGAPVDGSNLPGYVSKFLDTPQIGSTLSRRQEMFDFWKNNYHVDPGNKDTLGGINDTKRQHLFWLNTRIILLWSLRNHIQAFDHELKELSNLVSPPETSSAVDQKIDLSGLSHNAAEAASLLKVESAVSELRALNGTGRQDGRRLELEAFLLERILSGILEVRIATDKVDEELHYSYDIALSQLLSARFRALQRNFEVNFIQNGVAVEVAKFLFLKGFPKAANEVLEVGDGIGTSLSGLALWQNRGGKRLMGTPNSLADFLELDPDRYHFSKLITAFLNTPSTESNDGKSRKEELKLIWKKEKLSAFNVDSKSGSHKLAAVPPAKYDTIKILTSRINLLQSLKANLEFFDRDLLELMEQTDPETKWFTEKHNSFDDSAVVASLSPAATEACRLLGITKRVAGSLHGLNSQNKNDEAISHELMLVRRVMQSSLEVRVTADRLDLEIVRETNARDRLARIRDTGIAITNNANFFQLGILGLVSSGPLALSSVKRYQYYSHMTNVVSGYLVGGLTGLSFVQQKGGIRREKARPNMLSGLMGLHAEPGIMFSPLIWKFFNSPNPHSSEGKTRKQQLYEYWQKTKVVSLNPGNHVAAEKVAAEGPGHHWWCETIKLINNRINMLYAVRATVDLLDIGLAELLAAAE